MVVRKETKKMGLKKKRIFFNVEGQDRKHARQQCEVLIKWGHSDVKKKFREETEGCGMTMASAEGMSDPGERREGTTIDGVCVCAIPSTLEWLNSWCGRSKLHEQICESCEIDINVVGTFFCEKANASVLVFFSDFLLFFVPPFHQA